MRKGGSRMYIHPFLAGVLFTLFVIIVTFIVVSMIKSKKMKNGGR